MIKCTCIHYNYVYLTCLDSNLHVSCIHVQCSVYSIVCLTCIGYVIVLIDIGVNVCVVDVNIIQGVSGDDVTPVKLS